MIRVALKGLAARPVRTALTDAGHRRSASPWCARAFTLTDTMRDAADSLSSAAYDGTDAVVAAKTAFKRRRERLDRPAPDDRRRRCSTAVRARAAASAVAVGDITDQAQDHRPRRQAGRRRPVLRRRLRRRARRAPTRLTPFRLESGRWATGAGRGRHRPGAPPSKQHYAVGATVRDHHARRGARRSASSASRASATSSRSARATIAVFDLRDRADAVRQGTGRTTTSSSPAARRPAATLRARGRGRGRRRARSQTAAADDRFTLDGLKTFIEIIRTILLVLRRRGGARRRVHDLQHALDHRRPAHA